jgi:hypothetical protein
MVVLGVKRGYEKVYLIAVLQDVVGTDRGVLAAAVGLNSNGTDGV